MSEIKVGDVVDYHSVMDEPATSFGHEVTHILEVPNNFGYDVAWITGKSGCVCVEALSLQNEEENNG
jgi:hypothetical protein